MPLVLLRVSLIAWRVPNETRTESVARISDGEISAIVATRAGSRKMLSVEAGTWAGGGGGSPPVTANPTQQYDTTAPTRAGAGGEGGTEQDAANRAPRTI